MGRIEEIINYANSYQGKGVEIEELKDIIKLAIIDGALWADANPKWKPSEEQMTVCKEVYADLLSAKGFNLGTVNSELNRLEEELKKLKQ